MQPYFRKDPLFIIQGCSFEHGWDWTAGGQPVDLTGTRFELVAKASASDSKVLIYLSTENGGIKVSGNTITLLIPVDKTKGYGWRAAVFDLRVTWPSGRVDLFMSGKIEVRPGVLNAP
ncbi:hypothetical protein HA052_22900 [Chromobacterium haemolyticum]|uniref:Uncharacterized protein n=1 Tax=Chromobacterium fluminis TaxID=3044269 RepID=A0ABX0LGH7_9NEIS|nr:hypothetical protein [Chromobacterium haemolyticum]NHR08043.1 hypothetical protein [Chromobacterium haemolyticum]